MSLLDTDKVLLYCHPSVVDASNLQESRLYFGDNDITYIGFPSTGGNAGMNFRTGVAINAGSENIAGAWELVKCYIEQPDLSLGCVPVLQQVYEEKDRHIIFYISHENSEEFSTRIFEI